MTRLEKKITLIIGVLFFLLIVLLGFNAWWANVPPKRPANVPSSAAYYPGLADPFPTSKNGDWVDCWFDSTRKADWCRVTYVDGRLLFEGVFLPFPEKAPIPGDGLVIDSKTMNRAQQQVDLKASSEESSEPGIQVVPLVYLRNGNVLIPSKAYEQEKKWLEELQKAHSPYAPPDIQH